MKLPNISDQDKKTFKKAGNMMMNFSDTVLSDMRNDPIQVGSPLGLDKKKAEKKDEPCEITSKQLQHLVKEHKRHVSNCPFCMMKEN